MFISGKAPWATTDGVSICSTLRSPAMPSTRRQEGGKKTARYCGSGGQKNLARARGTVARCHAALLWEAHLSPRSPSPSEQSKGKNRTTPKRIRSSGRTRREIVGSTLTAGLHLDPTLACWRRAGPKGNLGPDGLPSPRSRPTHTHHTSQHGRHTDRTLGDGTTRHDTGSQAATALACSLAHCLGLFR